MPRRPSHAWPFVLGFVMVGACATGPTTGGGGTRRSPAPSPAAPLGSPSAGQDPAASGASPAASPEASASPAAIASPAASASASPAATASAQPRITFPLRLTPALSSSLVGATNAGLLQDSSKVATLGSVVQLDEQGRLLANNAGNLIGNHGGGLISDHGGGLIGNHGGGYRLAQAQPTPRPDFDATGVARSFQFAKEYALAIVDLTAFIDQAMLAWAKASPVLGKWQAFSYTATARVASGGLELFPALYAGQKLDMQGLARLQGDSLELAFFYGHPDLKLQWLQVQAKRDGSARYTYSAGPMTNHIIETRNPNHPIRLELNGRFQAQLAGGQLVGQEEQGFFQVGDAVASGPSYLVGREDAWRVTPESGSNLIAAERHLLGPVGSRFPSYEGGRNATRLFPDGRGLFWAAYADGHVTDTPSARFLYVAPDGKHSELNTAPPAWFFDAEGKQVANLSDLAPQLPPANALDGVVVTPRGGLSLGGSRYPFTWTPLSADAPF